MRSSEGKFSLGILALLNGEPALWRCLGRGALQGWGIAGIATLGLESGVSGAYTGELLPSGVETTSSIFATTYMSLTYCSPCVHRVCLLVVKHEGAETNKEILNMLG